MGSAGHIQPMPSPYPEARDVAYLHVCLLCGGSGCQPAPHICHPCFRRAIDAAMVVAQRHPEEWWEYLGIESPGDESA